MMMQGTSLQYWFQALPYLERHRLSSRLAMSRRSQVIITYRNRRQVGVKIMDVLAPHCGQRTYMVGPGDYGGEAAAHAERGGDEEVAEVVEVAREGPEAGGQEEVVALLSVGGLVDGLDGPGGL